MNIKILEKHIMENIPLEKLLIDGNEQHIYITAIGDIFINMNDIKKQQIIYKPLTQYIIEKKIHAITINTFTCLEWNKKNKDKKYENKYD